MKNFKRACDYLKFESAVKFNSRYIRNPFVEDFLSALLSSSVSRKICLPKDTVLWRSQLGKVESSEVAWEERVSHDSSPKPFPQDRMKPPMNMASEGRANPKGIAYMYLAMDQDTEMAEVRPWIGSEISLGRFLTMKELSLVDCTIQPQTNTPSNDIKKEPLDEFIWAEIERAYSEPITVSDYTPEYVPTQIIAELFKNNDFDGVKYKSSLGEGYNIVLFDPNAAEMTHCFLYKVRELKFTFEKVEGAWYATPYGQSLNQKNT
jgi:hypothetical protein